VLCEIVATNVIELLPFIAPKLSAVGVGSLNDMDFAHSKSRTHQLRVV
jgi:hypothetical protein